MPEDLGERTEDPTERRIRQAREKGQVARSADLSAAIVLSASVVMCMLLVEFMLRSSMKLMRFSLSEEALGERGGSGSIVPQLIVSMSEIVRIVGPFMVVVVLVSFVGAVTQVGWHITPEGLAPKWGRLNPLSGVKNVMGKKALVKGGIDLMKFALIAVVVVWIVRGQHREVLALANLDLLSGVMRSAEMVRDLALWVLAVLIVLAAIDFKYQRWQHSRELRMTKQEVKEERRESEGDMEMKGRRLRFARQIAMQRLAASVPKADVVVTNPTHYAVALKYDESSGMKAPRVIAKGADYLALKIRYLASSNGVPIVERPPLARALYNDVPVGKEIHPQHYEAVAEVLAYVYRLEQTAA